MTTAEWIHAIKAIEAKNDASIASHRQRKAARRAAALENIRAMSDTGDESGVANSNAHEISAADAAASAAGALLRELAQG